jgi:Protein of unknown function (DUF2997).
MEQVTIIVGKDGATEVSVQCVKGKKCSEVSEQIEKALGSRTKDAPTAEMREQAHANHHR